MSILQIFTYLWTLPYMRWYIVLVFIPSIILWCIWGKYFFRYWRVFIIITVGAFLWGLPLDILSVPILHTYGFNASHNLGINFLGLPLEEYFFFIFIPQEAVAVTLLVRKILYE